ncbi:hypothetical protein Tco_0672121 [Tanacetum coccineum]
MAAVCASRAVVKSAVTCRMASKVMAGVSDVDVLLGGILSTKDNTWVEEEDGEWIHFLGGNSSSGTKKYRGSNSNDGGNTRDGVKIAGGVIGSGDEIGKMTLRAQETCMIWLGHIGGLEGDEEGLLDVLVKLETSFEEFSVSTTFFWKEKEKSRTVTLTLPQSQGLEASGTLPQKRKKPKSKKPPTKTKHKPTTTTDPKDSEGNVQLADKGLPSTASNEGTAKTTQRLEGPLGDKDSEGNKTPADMEPINLIVADLSGTGAKYQVDETQSTRLRYQTLPENKGKTSSEVEQDHETLQLTTLADIQAYLLSEDELAQESDEEEVFAAGDDMEEDTQADEEEHQSPSPNKDKPEPTHTLKTQVSDSDSSSPDLKKYDNTLPLTERQLVKYLRKAFDKGYYEENVNHREQTDKVIDAAMNSLDKNSIARGDILNAINGWNLFRLLLLAKKQVAEWAKSSTSMAWNLGLRMTKIKNSQAEIKTKVFSLRQDTSYIKSMMTEIYQAFKEPPSHTEGETKDMEIENKEEKPEEPKMAIPISSIKPIKTPTPEVQPITTIITSQPESSQAPKRVDKGKRIATDDDES